MSGLSNVHEEFGPMLIGLVIAAIFCGITVVQGLTFLRTNQRDPIQHRLAVYFLLFLDLLHICFFTHSVYYYLVSMPLGGEVLVVWSFNAFVFMHGFLIPIVQLFYVARIWKLVPRNRIIIPIFLLLIVLSNLALGICMPVFLSKTKTLREAFPILSRPSTKAYFVLRICSDILIAASIIPYLARASTNLSWTDSSLTMLIAYLLNTNAIPSLLSIAVFCSVLAQPTTLIFLTIEEIAAKLYVNSFMAMLNARYYLQSPNLNNSSAFLLQSGMASEAYPMDKMRKQTPKKTINEVGLPLFQSDSRRDDADSDVRVEVVVKKDTQRVTK